MDIVGAGLALIAVAPVIAVVALAIKLDSRGPVFFRQKRIGRDGERFCIIKFRTMVPDAEARKAELRHRGAAAGGPFKLEDDPRVTRVGRLLRRTSLDELPQLVNVLRGEMSLVGPRPLVLDEDEQIVGWHRRRLHLTPGVTGAWQVLGSTRVPLRDMVALDYLYIVNWSPWRDVEIALRTVAYMLGRRGV
jgi:lipopolysaccharide/colanic/teichoic acid biosynthesis glycosyltransferase